MVRPKEEISEQALRRVGYGVTAEVSTRKLLRNQLDWLNSYFWEENLLATSEKNNLADLSVEDNGLVRRKLSGENYSNADAKVIRTWIIALKVPVREDKNLIVLKAGLLGGIGAWILQILCRRYTIRGPRPEGTSGPLSET